MSRKNKDYGDPYTSSHGAIGIGMILSFTVKEEKYGAIFKLKTYILIIFQGHLKRGYVTDT